MADQSAQYEMLEELGSGSFGVVYKARERKTGELVAIKHVDLEGSEDNIQDIQQEIALLSTCASPYITKYKTSFVRGVKLWIVMEYLGGGSCLDLVKAAPFDESHAAIICRELLLGLDYLHKTGKIHRDIKAANILLSSTGKVKIADFGVAAQLTNIKSQRMTFVGTPFWMAPEVIQEAGYDFRADIWSLGITTIELVKGAPPHADIHPMKALFHIPKEPAPRLEGSKFSRELKSFIAACLIKDPDRRPTAKELLQHRFIMKAGKVDNLRNLIALRRRQQKMTDERVHIRYYEETMKEMSPVKSDDDWVFDTIKPSTTKLVHHPTFKKRKISEPSIEPLPQPPTDMMMQLDLNENIYEQGIAPLPMSMQAAPPIHSNPGTVQRLQRRHSAVATMRKVSSPLKPTSSPNKKTPELKQPLGVDLSFGNSTSTTRQFRRLSGDLSNIPRPEATDCPTNENVPPQMEVLTKEGKLGRRFFSKIMEPSLQEVQSQTALQRKRDVISKVEQAWAALDALDPEGEYMLMKIMLDKIQGDSKFVNLLSSPSPLTPAASPQKPTKLILAQNNPHLKSHRRRQSSQVSLTSGMNVHAFAEKMSGLPGQAAQPGMEQTKQLTDALYGRWIEGMRSKWPQV